jgi:hypothetical protein
MLLAMKVIVGFDVLAVRRKHLPGLGPSEFSYAVTAT